MWAWKLVWSRPVYASSDPPRASSSWAIALALRRSVPLNTRCSRRCAAPIDGRGSCAEAVRTQSPTAHDRTEGKTSVRMVRPFGAVVRINPSSRRTVSTGSLLRDQGLPGQLHAAALIDLEELDLHDVALLHDVLGLLHAAMLQLADVEEPLDARHDLDE